MLINFPSSSNASLPHLHSSSAYFTLYICISSTAAAFSVIAFAVTSIILVLPLCIYVIYVGLQRWRHQCASVTMSHSDSFTYHMVIIELMNIVAVTLHGCAILTDLPLISVLSSYLLCINTNGQQSFHILTCVERYLAVVHPVTYLGLRNAKGIRIRNITLGCVWLVCFSSIGLMFVEDEHSIRLLSYLTIAVIFIVICFCSFSVLHILIRPGPGEGGGGRQRIDQSKLRAVYTIMAILAVLLLRFVGAVGSALFYASAQLESRESKQCVVWLVVMWSNLPSSLILPLLFLHRAGKLTCCRNTNNESGQGSD